MVNFTVEKLQLKDIDEFYKTFIKVLGEGFPEYLGSAQEFFRKKDYTKNFFAKHIKNGLDFIAKTGNKVVGFSIADNPYGGVSFGRWLGVLKEYRGGGIGKALVLRWEKEAKRGGAHRLQFITDRRNIPFYKKLGFKLEGFAKTGYFGADNYYFGKIIGRPAKSH